MAKSTPKQPISIVLTEAQRRLIAELVPELTGRLRLAERNQRAIDFSAAETRSIQSAARSAVSTVDSGIKRNSLRRVIDKLKSTASSPSRRGGTSKSGPVYRFKITLLDWKPLIWRRIEVNDCTFDKLHEHIQAAMGWTNSHLHQFKIGDQCVGDPELLDDGFMDFECINSRRTKLSQLLPADARRFRFIYEYDFGDGWEHEVLLERVTPLELGERYPVCLGGERSCPPEDVGGVWGYAGFLEAVQDPKHKEHSRYLEWCGGSFDPEHFDAAEATRMMRRGLPDWRDLY